MYKLKTNKMKTQLENHELDLLIDLMLRFIKEYNETLYDNPEEVLGMIETIKEKLELQKIDLQIK